MDAQGTIGIKATLDISEMQRNVQRYVQNINMMQDHTDVASQSVAKSFSRMQAAAGAYLSIDMAKRLASEMVSVYGTFQQLDIAFRTMLHSGEKAKVLMEELVNFAAVTPFNLTDVGQGAKQLLAYGTAANKITTEIEMLGNVASGVTIPLGDLIYLYGTLRSQGRAYTVDIRQFAGRGIPIYEELAKVLNVSVGEVSSLVEAGRVGFPEVEKAFQNMTNKGGTFFNLMRDQSKAVTGQISNLMDNIDTKLNEVGKSNDALITGGISGANYLVDHYKEVGSALATLIALYGVHKTALIANAAFYGAMKKGESAAIFKVESEALHQLETAEIKANLSKQGLTAGTKEYIEALKVEIKTEMDRLTQVAIVANTELDAAKDRLDAANNLKEQALQNVQLKKDELNAAISLAQTEKSTSLEKQMSIESEKQSRAALLTYRLEQERNAAIQSLKNRKDELSAVLIQAQMEKAASIEKQMSIEKEKQSRAALLAVKLSESKVTQIETVKEMKSQQMLLSSSGKDTAAIEAKITARQRNIASISEKITAAKAEEVQHSRNVVALRSELKATNDIIASNKVLTASQIEEINGQQQLQASHYKQVSAIEAKIVAKQKEIAAISEKITVAKAEEVQRSRNVVSLRGEMKAIDDNVSTKTVDKAQTAVNTAKQKLNSAELNTNTAAREVNQLETKVGIAAKSADTLTTQLNTIEEKKNVAAKSLSAKAAGLLSKSWGKLNAAVAANVWTIAIAGILAASYGIYKLITYQTEAEKWQGKLNDRFREFNSEVSTEQTEIDRLFGKLDAATKGTKEYDTAKKSILDKYGEYLKGLGDEIEQLTNVEAAYKAVSAAARQSAIDRAITDAKGVASDTYKENSTKHLEQLEKAIRGKIKNERDASALYTTIVQDIQKNGVLSNVAADIVNSFTKNKYTRGVNGIERLSKIDNPIRDAVEAFKNDSKVLDTAFSDIEQKFGKGSVDYLSMTSEQIKKVIVDYEAEIKAGRETVQITIDLSKAREALTEVEKKENQHAETVAERKVRWAKELETAETKLKELKADNSTATKKQIEDQQQIVDELKKDLGIDDKAVNSKEKKQEEANRIKAETADRLLAIKEAQREILQQEINGELEIRQQQINLLQEGSKKTRAQIQLDYDKRKNEIDKQYAALLKQVQEQERKQWEADNPKWKDKGLTFSPTAKLSDNQLKQYADAMLMAFSEMTKKQADYYKGELEQYQTYEEKRKQIQDKYKKLREDAVLSGNSARLGEIDREEKNAIKDVDKYFGEREESFKVWANGIVNFSLQQLVSMLEQAQTKLNLVRMKSGKGTELGDTDEVAKYRAQIIELQNRIKELNINTSSTTTTSYKDWKRLYEVLDDANSKLKDIGSSIGGATGEIIAFASDIATSTLTMIASITKLANWSVEATKLAASGASKAIQTVEKASVILAVISAALQIIGAITNAFSALKEKEKEHEEYIKGIIDLQNSYNSELIKTKMLHDEVWGKNHLGDALSDIWAITEATEDYNNLLVQQQKAWKDPDGNFWKKLYKYGTIMGWVGLKPGELLGVEQKEPGYTELVNNLRYVTKKANKGFLGIGGNHTKTQDLRDWVKENLGGDLFDESGQLNLTLAQELVDNHSDRLAGETKDNLEKLIEAQQLIEDAEKALTDYISETFGSLGDGLSDAIVDAFRNGTDAALAFKGNIIEVLEEVGQQMVRNLFVQKAVKQYEDDLEKVYKDYADRMDDSTDEDEKLFNKELAEVTEKFFGGAMSAIENGNKFLEQYQEEMKKHGFDLYKPDDKDSDSRTAIEQGIQGVSQDSITEMNGRLTATTMFLSDILKAVMSQTEATNSMCLVMVDMKAVTVSINDNIRIIRDNTSVIISHLESIDNNTSKLNDIQKDMSSVRKGIERINDKGVKMQ